jgi:hypothetical protein
MRWRQTACRSWSVGRSGPTPWSLQRPCLRAGPAACLLLDAADVLLRVQHHDRQLLRLLRLYHRHRQPPRAHVVPPLLSGKPPLPSLPLLLRSFHYRCAETPNLAADSAISSASTTATAATPPPQFPSSPHHFQPLTLLPFESPSPLVLPFAPKHTAFLPSTPLRCNMPPQQLLMTMRLRGGMQSAHPDHTSAHVAAARLPPPHHQEDRFVSNRIMRAYDRTVRLDTTDLSVITIINSRDITFHLRGYLVQSDRSRVRYDAATRERTVFEFCERTTSGALTWDRFLYLDSLLGRLSISCPDLQEYRPVLEMRDRLHARGRPHLTVAADGDTLWLSSLSDPTLRPLQPELLRLGFSLRERGSGRCYAANLSRRVIDSLAQLGRLYLVEMDGLPAASPALLAPSAPAPRARPVAVTASTVATATATAATASAATATAGSPSTAPFAANNADSSAPQQLQPQLQPQSWPQPQLLPPQPPAVAARWRTHHQARGTPLPAGWHAATDASGHTYFWDDAGGVQWSRPVSAVPDGVIDATRHPAPLADFMAAPQLPAPHGTAGRAAAVPAITSPAAASAAAITTAAANASSAAACTATGGASAPRSLGPGGVPLQPPPGTPPAWGPTYPAALQADRGAGSGAPVPSAPTNFSVAAPRAHASPAVAVPADMSPDTASAAATTAVTAHASPVAAFAAAAVTAAAATTSAATAAADCPSTAPLAADGHSSTAAAATTNSRKHKRSPADFARRKLKKKQRRAASAVSGTAAEPPAAELPAASEPAAHVRSAPAASTPASSAASAAADAAVAPSTAAPTSPSAASNAAVVAATATNSATAAAAAAAAAAAPAALQQPPAGTGAVATLHRELEAANHRCKEQEALLRAVRRHTERNTRTAFKRGVQSERAVSKSAQRAKRKGKKAAKAAERAARRGRATRVPAVPASVPPPGKGGKGRGRGHRSQPPSRGHGPPLPPPPPRPPPPPPMGGKGRGKGKGQGQGKGKGKCTGGHAGRPY